VDTSVRPSRFDIALAAGLVALQLTGAGEISGLGVHHQLVSLVLPVAVVARRVAPLAVVLAYLVTTLVAAAVNEPQPDSVATFLAAVVAIYSAGAYLPLWRAAGVFVLWMCVVAVVLIQDQSPADDWLFRAGLLFAAWVPGVVARRLRVSEEAAQEAAAEEKRRAETGAEQAVARERARIARELHDVVAHAVTLMVVQAAVAEELHERDSQAARAALASVQTTGRSAIAELDRMLRLLREPDGGVGPLPSLAGVPDLIAEAGRAGVRAELVEQEMRSAESISPAMQICAYRVVQEALTNAAKHTRNPQLRVVLRQSAETLEIEVEDDGGAGPRDTPGTGYGLTGLRERVSLFGGTLETGLRAGGGFRVFASLPVTASETVQA
jgi:signal transduction histidine kinase